MDGEAFFEALDDGDKRQADRLAQAEAELELAIQIGDRREALGLSQADLARRVGVSQPVIARLERAGRTPTPQTLWRLAAALHVQFVFGPNYTTSLVPLTPALSAHQEVVSASNERSRRQKLVRQA